LGAFRGGFSFVSVALGLTFGGKWQQMWAICYADRTNISLAIVPMAGVTLQVLAVAQPQLDVSSVRRTATHAHAETVPRH
jgi:hypothetical protein